MNEDKEQSKFDKFFGSSLNPIATGLGGLAGGFISNGLSSPAGDITNTIGDLASTIPGPWGAILGSGTKILGGLTNAAFGTSVDQEKLNTANAGTNYLNSFTSDASSFDDIQGPVRQAGVQDAYKGGWFTSKKAKKKNAALREERALAEDYADRNVENNINNISATQTNNALANFYASGGLMLSPLHSYGADWDNGVTIINNGGSHEQNPYEGVPMGIAEDGQPNLVEEGEVIFNDYVFSNRIRVPKAVRNKYKLRGQKELTFADAAKKAQKESEERPNDPISQRGLNDIMNKLTEEQELIKAKREAKKEQREAQIAEQEAMQAELANQELNQDVNQEINPEELQGMQFKKGGPMNKNNKNKEYYKAGKETTLPQVEITAERPKFNAAYAPLLNAVTMPKFNVITPEPVVLPKANFTDNTTLGLNPLNVINDRRNNLMSSYLLPDNTVFAYGGLKHKFDGGGGRQVATIVGDRNQVYNGRKAFLNFNADNPAPFYRSPYTLFSKVSPLTTLDSNLTRPLYDKGVITPTPFRTEINEPIVKAGTFGAFKGLEYPDEKASIEPAVPITAKPVLPTTIKAVDPKKISPYFFDTDGKKKQPKNSFSDRMMPNLRYTPALASGLMALSDAFGWTNKPDYSNTEYLKRAVDGFTDASFTPIGDYLTYKPMDRLYATNMLNAQAGATRRNIMNTSGGNRGTAMAGLLASDANAQNQLGTLFRQAEEANFANRAKVAEFNRATNTANSEGFLKAQMANMGNNQYRLNAANRIAEMRDAIDARVGATKSANLSNFITNLGNLGVDAFNRLDRDRLIKEIGPEGAARMYNKNR